MTADGAPVPLSRLAAMARLVSLLVVLAGLAAVAVQAGPDVGAIRRWVDGTGVVAPLVFMLAYVVLTVAVVPGSILTAAAGLLFGAAVGTFLTLVGATVGATAAFLIARTVGRRAVERLASGKVARVDRWLGERGFTAVLTLRLVPLVPFSAANYAAGVTAIRLRDYVLGTAIGIVPGTIAFNVLGDRVADPGDPVFLAATAVLALLAVGGTVALRRSSRAGTSEIAGTDPDAAGAEPASSRP